jgi:hypothetical protein
VPAAGSRLNGYPGRVASLRIAAGMCGSPSRHQREVNVRLFEAAVHDVRTAVAALRRDRRPPVSQPTSTSWEGRGGQRPLDPVPAGVSSANTSPPEGVDLALGSPPPPPAPTR